MLKIAIIQRFLPSRSRGGVGHFTHGLANALCNRGHKVTVFSQDPALDGALYNVVMLPASRAVFGLPTAPLAFPLQIARQDFSAFDVLHAQGDEQLVARRQSLPVVRTLHGSSLAEAIHNGWRGRSLKRLLLHLYFYLWEVVADLRADQVVAISADTRRHFPRVHAVIGNGVDVERFFGASESKSDVPSLLFVGEIASRKRGDLLIEIFHKEIRPAMPAAELWLVGPDRIAAANVRSFGNVDDRELARLYQQAWVFCLPSSYEGFGRPYVEAMAAGTPVVATSNPGANEVLDGGRFGFIVPEEKLAQVLLELLNDSALRKHYGERGIARAADYAWPQVAKRYEQIYEQVLRERAGEVCPV